MTDQIVLACDERGRFTGEYLAKELAHTGAGHRHLAITVLLYNSQGQVLLQRRKHRIFDNVWDFTGATHLLHRDDGSDETYEDATARCLETEYGIRDVDARIRGAVSYFVADGPLCENEHVAILIGEYNGTVTMNPEVAYDCIWMQKSDLLRDIERDPRAYSPWAVEGVKVLRNAGFFDEHGASGASPG